MEYCTYTSPSGKLCGKPAINTDVDGSCQCHIKSHWPDVNKYTEFVQRRESEFNSSTTSISEEQIETVTKDGACFYRTVAKHIIHNPEAFDMDVENLTERDIAEKVQSNITSFIEENKDKQILQFGSQTFEDAILETHDEICSFEHYIDLYKIFAGDNDYIYEETIDKNGKKRKKKVEIPDRWGSSVEQVAISMLYGMTINVHLLQKFDKRMCRVIEVTKRAKNIRTKLYQVINPEIEDMECKVPELNIILEKQNITPHYQYIST